MVTTSPRVEVTSVRLQSRSDVSNQPQASACGVSSRKTPSREAAAEGICDRHHRASAAASRLSDIYEPFPVGRRPRLIAAVASRLIRIRCEIISRLAPCSLPSAGRVREGGEWQIDLTILPPPRPSPPRGGRKAGSCCAPNPQPSLRDSRLGGPSRISHSFTATLLHPNRRP